MAETGLVGKAVYTRLGQGRVVYRLPDGTLLVEFPHGGGQIFMPEEITSGGPTHVYRPRARGIGAAAGGGGAG